MIVTCPACSSRYRIKDEKIQGRGAKISCPKCDHKFVVHREADPAADPKGVPVTFARGGKKMRRELDEDDEADVPTTVMPHGSQVAQQIKAAAAASLAPEAPPRPQAPAIDKQAAFANAVARNQRPATVAVPASIEIPQDDAPPSARQLRTKGAAAKPAAVDTKGRSGPRPAILAAGFVGLVVIIAAVLKISGVV
jgi:predicted Zn finger-like uncharacterized protein